MAVGFGGKETQYPAIEKLCPHKFLEKQAAA
jgi:hypothetical protein